MPGSSFFPPQSRWRVLPRGRSGLLLGILLLVGAACGGGGGGSGGGGSSGGGGAQPAAGAFATELQPAGSNSWGVLLVVASGAKDKLAAYLVSCGGSGWTLPIGDTLTGHDVPIRDGAFTVQNADVRLSGRFSTPTTIEGTVEARSQTSTDCGLPQRAAFTARCGAPIGVSYLSVGGKEVPLNGPCT